MKNEIPTQKTISALLFKDATQSFNRACEDGHSDKHGQTYEAIVAIILSMAAAEAFINELYVMFYSIQFFRMDKTTTKTPEDFFKLSIEDKYCEVSTIISGKALNKGERPFQDFHNLVLLRNCFIHYKMRDSNEGESESYYHYLRTKGLLTDSKQKLGSSDSHWLDQVSNIRIARWSINTISQMVNQIYAMMDKNTKVLFNNYISIFAEVK